MWLTWILSNWKTVLIGTVIASLVAYGAVMNLRLQVAQAELGEKTAVIESMQNAAALYQRQSEQVAKEISDAHREHVLAAERNAFENAKRKFRTVARCPAVGIGTHGVLPTQHGDGQASGAGGTVDATAEEQVAVGRSFVEACATDSSTILLWQRWATLNELKVSEQ